jgi:hypothetical protein
MSVNQLFQEVKIAPKSKIGITPTQRRKLTPIQLARRVAARLCKLEGSTDADRVGAVLWRDYGIKSLGPLAGAIFKDDQFEFAGLMVPSSRLSNHSRKLKVWKLKSQPKKS